MIQLTKREINILLRLLNVEGSVTTKELADQFQVSIRTIKYDLDNIRFWLKERNIELHSRRSKGIWFELSKTEQLNLKNELLEVERFEMHPDQEIRITRIVLRLLLAEEQVTTQELADYLSVTKNTVISDLDKIDSFLARYKLVLNRRSGWGLELTGSEGDCRFLMEYILHSEITEYDIYQIMNQLTQSQSGQKHEIYLGKDTPFYEVYRTVISKMAALLDPTLLDQFNYAEILAITFRVAISACRMSISETMGSYKLLANQELLIEKRDLPFLLMRDVFDHYELPLLETEYVYIFSDNLEEANQQDIVQLTKQLISEVSQALKVPFTKDQQLFTNLFAHLSLRLVRKHVFINEYNPFVDDIKSMHPQLFEAIKRACQNEIMGFSLLINDSFVAYIALHFLVYFEKERKEQTLTRIVYVCSTGLGVTSLIQQKIMEEIPNVEIISFASVLNALEVIEAKKPDIVISIFPIEGIRCPFIKVNPLPSKEDIQAIKDIIKHSLNNDSQRSPEQLTAITVPKATVGVEEVSRDVIVKGYIVYEELSKLFGTQLKEDYREAFLLHVLLMVHRIVFQAQYDSEGNVIREVLLANREVVAEVEQLFSANDLLVNQAEITALLQYIYQK